MSKINAVRLINVNYNNNAICVSDECFHINGESTLMCLQNGGGKSVLVQMLTAPFVHKKYRNVKDRPFESYFTTHKPSFILVEWALEQNAGYVLTGMMVRKSQEEIGEKEENLDIVTIISEYKEPCIQDIYHLPVVEKGKKERVLKSFSTCRQLFEGYKRDSSMDFFCYDMNNNAQSRQYFNKLAEYQIYYKEWEAIIKKVNLKESGLSELFANCRDEKGLTETWFLSTIENKLNRERDRIKEFQVILEKYVGQYKDNRSKIERRDTINLFKEQAAFIAEKGKSYEKMTEELKKQENKIACFIQKLNQCHDITEQEKNQILKQMDELELEIARMEYERLSAEFYQLEEKLRYHSSNCDMIEMEKEDLERNVEKTEQILHLLTCAKQQEEVNEWKAETAKAKQKLLIYKQKKEDLEPERNTLGYKLKCYYDNKIKENKEQTSEKKKEADALLGEINNCNEELERLNDAVMEQIGKEGHLKGRLELYAQQENRFNSHYKENLARNILGVYEPGSLEILQSAYEKELEGGIREERENRKKQENLRDRQKVLERNLEDKKEECIKKQEELKTQQKLLDEYEAELKERCAVLRYVNLGEDSLFEREKILKELEKKLVEISGIKRALERDENELVKEHEKLVTGKMMELPKELEEKLTELGINIVYGMEWLKKNGYTESENQKLVLENPFLPYALILSKQEIKRLSEHAADVYTSFPIPIITREQLNGSGIERQSAIAEFSGVCFYIWFNNELLSEEKLQILILANEEKQQKKRNSIQIRQAEYNEYFARKELIKNQKVETLKYNGVKEQIGDLEKQIVSLETGIDSERKELQEVKACIEKEEALARKLEKQIAEQKRRLEDFGELRAAYLEYEEHQKQLEKCIKLKHRFLDNQKLAKELLEKCKRQQETLKTALDFLEKTYDNLGKAYQRYQDYQETAEGLEAISDETATELEARYCAITANLSLELKELEQQVENADDKYKKAVDELEYLRGKYKLEENAWVLVRYNRKEEIHQEAILEDYQKKVARKTSLWSEENTQMAVVRNDMKKCRQQIKMVCEEEAPIAKEKIQKQDYEACKKQLEYQKNELAESITTLQKQLQSYAENLTALAEYSELPVEEDYIWEQKIEELDSKELRNMKGILIRDYNAGILGVQNAKEQLIDTLQKILRMEKFQDDFYKKPLEAMLDVSQNAKQVLSQLDITLKAYDSLMNKLLVDIAMIEKEKEKVVELLGDYVHEVHDNLGKIDTNSTITIREKPIKMLKIQLPNWEENIALYQLRLNDFVDEITERGTELFEKNENAQEYFGTRITTKNLYDAVVGLGNVQIRLYKIEAQREYPITWAEVAKNSGGEGFLSAFVILSSLLHYMRKDDTDIFAEKNEGKVLLMDNPFAQTNASHLLKPLMDMAKKTNTQLICLTGLGGESIYNRFNNIYVMNLIAASLKRGTLYLKSEHLRGNEPQTLETSQIEVVEQMELLF